MFDLCFQFTKLIKLLFGRLKMFHSAFGCMQLQPLLSLLVTEIIQDGGSQKCQTWSFKPLVHKPMGDVLYTVDDETFGGLSSSFSLETDSLSPLCENLFSEDGRSSLGWSSCTCVSSPCEEDTCRCWSREQNPSAGHQLNGLCFSIHQIFSPFPHSAFFHHLLSHFIILSSSSLSNWFSWSISLLSPPLPYSPCRPSLSSSFLILQSAFSSSSHLYFSPLPIGRSSTSCAHFPFNVLVIQSSLCLTLPPPLHISPSSHLFPPEALFFISSFWYGYNL